jgi:hypothetical protein
MCGSGKSSTIELGFDLTDFASVVAAGQGTFFFRAMSKGGSGTVNSVSLMDYNGSTVKEIPCSQTNVAMSSSTVLSVPWSGTVSTEIEKHKAIAAHQSNGLLAKYNSNSHNFLFTFPAGNVRSAILQIKDVSGRTVMTKTCSPALSGNTANAIWDMKNYLGQNVGSGAYVAAVNVTGADGAVRNLTTKLLVRD